MTDNAFTRALGEIAGAEDGRLAVRTADNGEVHAVVADIPITLACQEDDPDTVIVVARVCPTTGLRHPEMPLEDALEANFLWMGNAGSTLALDPENGDLILHDRRDARRVHRHAPGAERRQGARLPEGPDLRQPQGSRPVETSGGV